MPSLKKIDNLKITFYDFGQMDSPIFHFPRFLFLQSKEKMMKGVRRGCVRLKGAVIGIDDQDVCTFTITVDHKTFHFQVGWKKGRCLISKFIDTND